MTPRTRTVLREAALTVGAGLGLLCVLLAVVAPVFGVRLLVFQSGSMSPTVETGGLAVARSVAAADLAVGDIVSVHTASGQRVTHRIVGIEPAGAKAQLTLQGDANPAPDAEPYLVTEADRVLLHVNRLGFVANALASPYAVFLAGALVAGVVLLAFGRGGPGSTTGGRRRATRPATRGRRRAPVAVAVVAAVALASAAALVPSRVSPTAASFTDTASVPTGSLASTTVPPSASFTCGALGVLSVRFNWTAVAGATNYTLHYGSGGSQTLTTTNTTWTFTSALSGGTAWVVANRNFGSTVWSSVNSNTRSYTVALVSLCN
jgi:signal peptidase I